MGRGLAAGVEGMARLTERAAEMTGITSPRDAGKMAESAARTTMTAARSAARDDAACGTARTARPHGGTQRERVDGNAASRRPAVNACRKSTAANRSARRSAPRGPRRKRRPRRGAGKCLNRNQCSPSGPARRAAVAGSARDARLNVRWRTGCTVTRYGVRTRERRREMWSARPRPVRISGRGRRGRAGQRREVRASPKRRGWRHAASDARRRTNARLPGHRLVTVLRGRRRRPVFRQARNRIGNLRAHERAPRAADCLSR